MSVHLTLSCDGTRHGQPCRGALSTRAGDPLEARTESTAAGWRSMLDVAEARFIDVCPSRGHDGEAVPR